MYAIKENRKGSRQAKRRRTDTTSTLELLASICMLPRPSICDLEGTSDPSDISSGFPLQLSTERGISSIVVRCYYILGLSVKVTCGKVDILSGEEPCNIYVVESDYFKQV